MRVVLFPWVFVLLTSACTKPDLGTCEDVPAHLEISLNTPLSEAQSRFFSTNYLPCKQRKLKRNRNALYSVGVAVLHGLGTERDASKAFLWFKGAADKEHRGAQRVLADMFMQGVGVVKDPLIAQKYVVVSKHPPHGG